MGTPRKQWEYDRNIPTRVLYSTMLLPYSFPFLFGVPVIKVLEQRQESKISTRRILGDRSAYSAATATLFSKPSYVGVGVWACRLGTWGK